MYTNARLPCERFVHKITPGVWSVECGKRFWSFFDTRIGGCLRTHLASTKSFRDQRPHLGITACRTGVVGYPSGCASGCPSGYGAGCPSGSLSNFFENCGPNKENASSSIACIRRRVSSMSISDSSLEALETVSDLSRFLSRSWNVTQHLSAKIDSKSCFVIIFHPLVTKAVRTDQIYLRIIEISTILTLNQDWNWAKNSLSPLCGSTSIMIGREKWKL